MRTALAMMVLVVMAAMLLGSAPPVPTPSEPDVQRGSAFVTVDVFVDSGGSPLAAWQVEFIATSAGGKVMLVGIEGGEHAAYARPAHYDPAALAPDGGGGVGGRVILAAFNTGAAPTLPTGRTRVARLHVFVEGGEAGAVRYEVKVRVAADADANTINGATADAVAGEGR